MSGAYEIYHADARVFRNTLLGEYDDIDPQKDYSCVARITAQNVDDAYRLSNSIDHYWGDNPEVLITFRSALRSTSVGDIIVDPEGVKHRVARMGFTRLGVKT